MAKYASPTETTKIMAVYNIISAQLAKENRKFQYKDIEKGENWDSKISSELSQCNYGIVCLTSENTMAPRINI